jgi:hypothetical protein
MVPVLIGLSALAGMLCLAHATRNGIGIAPDSVSYIEAARNLGAGRGISISEDGVEYRPLTRFPPLYPVAIAAIARLGIDPLDAARWLAVALLGANVALVSLLVARSAPGARWLPSLGAVLMASAPEVAKIHGTAQSEPLFLLLGFAGLLFLSLHLEQRQMRALLAASLLVGLAFLTRFVGAALVATGVLALLLAPRAVLRRRVTDAAVFAAVAALPMAIWTLHSQLAGAPATGRSFAFHPIGRGAFDLAGRSIGQWLLLDLGGAPVAWPLGAGLLLCMGLSLRSGRARGAAAAMPRILLLLTIAYLILLLISISFLDAQTPLGGRMFAPLFVACLVLALCGARNGIRAWRSPMPALVAALLALIFTLSYARDTSRWVRERAAFGAEGFGSLAWRESETMRRVRDLPADALVFSNARDAIYILTGRTTRWLPAWVDAESRQPRRAYASELKAILAALRTGGTSLVWFDQAAWRWYLPARPELQQRLPIRRVLALRDGEIWQYDPSRDAPIGSRSPSEIGGHTPADGLEVEEDEEHDREETEAHVREHGVGHVEEGDTHQEQQARPRARKKEDQREAGFHHEGAEADDPAERLLLHQPIGQRVEHGLARVGGAPDQRAAEQQILDPPRIREPDPAGDAQLREHGPEVEGGAVDLHRLDRPARLPLRNRPARGRHLRAPPGVDRIGLPALREQQEEEHLDRHQVAVMHVAGDAVAHAL